MRVVAGQARGRVLQAPAGRSTRPTSDRVREAMFSILVSLDAVEDAEVLDLFAGSGALGVEALSRGAARVTFIDSDPEAVRVIRANLTAIGELAARSTVVQGDVLRVVEGAPFANLVLADPPYSFDRWPLLLERLAPRTGLLLAESGSGVDLGNAWETVKVKRYGSTVVTVGRPVAAADAVRQEGEI